MFFWKKKSKSEDVDQAIEQSMAVGEHESNAAVEASSAELKEGAVASQPSDEGVAGEDNVKLFPGFDGKPYQVGYAHWDKEGHALDRETPVLVMRWAGEENWFPVPSAFNQAFMKVIGEIEGDTSLESLLKSYGYDVMESRRR